MLQNTSLDNKGKNVLSEAEYKTRLSEYNDRRANAGSYLFVLTQVTTSKNMSIKGPSIFKYSDNKYRYEDNLIKLVIEKTYTMFEFTLENKTTESFKINWDDVVFVDANNTSRRIIHKGIKYIDASKPQAPTIIAAGTILDDLLVPVENVKYSSYSGDWYTDDIIPRNSRAGAYPNGTTMKIVLPIEHSGKIYEYTLVFNVVWEYTDPSFREQYLLAQ